MRYSDIEVRLFDFVQVARTARLPVTRKTLAARALSIREKLLHPATEDSTIQASMHLEHRAVGKLVL